MVAPLTGPKKDARLVWYSRVAQAFAQKRVSQFRRYQQNLGHSQTRDVFQFNGTVFEFTPPHDVCFVTDDDLPRLPLSELFHLSNTLASLVGDKQLEVRSYRGKE